MAQFPRVNAYIVVYPLQEEKEYLDRVKNDYKQEYIIDMSKLFVDLIDGFGLKMFKEMCKNFRSTPDQIFADQDSTEDDLLSYILNKIKQASKRRKNTSIN